MARRKKPAKSKEPAPGGEASELAPFAAQEIAQESAQESQVFTGNLSLHELFQRQVRQTLDQSDLDEDAKQAILVAMSCPCCGTGGMNYTVPLKRRT
jgi:hypothetical protein